MAKQPFDRYVDDIMTHLQALSPEKWAEIRAELSTHFHDAAVEHDGNPADPLVQARIVAEMGSSRRIGRGLARSHRVPATSRGPYLVGGLSAFLSAALLVTALVLMVQGYEERTIEFFVMIAPLALLPVVLALHRMYHSVNPKWSVATLATGLVPFGAIVAAWLGSRFVALDTPVVGVTMLVSLSLAGVWLILVGRLIRRGEPLIPAALTWLGSVLGVCWLIGLSSTAVNLAALQSTIREYYIMLLSVNILLLFISHLAWTTWLGCLFISRAWCPVVAR